MSEVDKLLGLLRREREIRCPWCDHLWRNNENQFITYHGEGEDSTGEVECGWCEKAFVVNEIVTRTWETSKVEA